MCDKDEGAGQGSKGSKRNTENNSRAKSDKEDLTTRSRYAMIQSIQMFGSVHVNAEAVDDT